MHIGKGKFIIAIVAAFVFGAVVAFGAFCIMSGLSSSSSIDDKKLMEIQRSIDSYYLEDYDRDELIEGMYKGYVQGLGDPYSAYMDAEEYGSWQATATGDYSGIGVTFSEDDRGRFVVLNVTADSPAEKAGIQQGDIILSVDGVEYEVSDVMASAIRGEAGTKVTLEIYRDGEKKEFTITRARIIAKSIEAEMIDDDTGYIKISEFVSSTGDDFDRELKKLEKQGAKSLILDLRDNGGGLVSESVSVADHFLDEGVICYVQDKNGNSESYDAEDGKTSLDTVVLVNENSASASEILAAALKDNGFAIVGKRTFGKGVIQTTMEMSDGSALKLTIMEYLSPDKHKVHKEGVKPDYVVKDKKSTKEDEQLQKAMELVD